MANGKLPHPATNADTYAHATVTELRRLNGNIERLVNILDEITKVQDEALQSDEVTLKEPVTEPKKPSNRDAKKAEPKAD
jgi:hypothetical protein